MAGSPAAADSAVRRLSWRGGAVFAIAALAVIIAAVVGIRGLVATPVESVDAQGVATLHGSWQPYSCDSSGCRGYVQDGGSSVFVVFAAACREPQRSQVITVRGRRDTSLGNRAYHALACVA